MHNDAFGEWRSSLNTKPVRIPYALNTIWGFLLTYVDMLCGWVGECLCHIKSLESFPCHRFWGFWGSNTGCQLAVPALYLLSHLAGPSPSLYSIVLAHIVFCLRPGRGGQVWIFFFHEFTKFWIWEFGVGSDRTGHSFLWVLLLTFLLVLPVTYSILSL